MCNNPQTKTPKVILNNALIGAATYQLLLCFLADCIGWSVCLQLEAAMRIASGDLFPTSWVEFDQRAKDLEARTNEQK